MKKKLLMCMIVVITVLGCIACGKAESVDSDKSALVDSKYDEFMEKVVGKEWYRPMTGCNEHICFSKNGDYKYEEACGAPLGKKSSYFAWEYDDKKDLITIYGENDDTENGIYEEFKDTVEYVSCDGDTLVLVIEGEKLTFSSVEPLIDAKEWEDKHSLTVTFRTKGGEFMWCIEQADWIQTDGSGNKIFFKCNELTEKSEFGYVNADGEVIEGFELFDTYYYEDADINESMNVILENSDGEETKTIVYMGYIDEKLVLEIDGKEVEFTRK